MKVMHASSRGDAASVPMIVMTVNSFAEYEKRRIIQPFTATGEETGHDNKRNAGKKGV